MSRSIQVQIDSAGHSAERVRLAATLASVNGAHLTGLYVVSEPRLPATMRASFAFPEMMQSHTEAIRNEARTWDGELRQIVPEVRRAARAPDRAIASDREGLPLRSRGASRALRGPRGRWGRRNPGSRSGPLASDLVMTSGRSAPTVPRSGRFETIGKRVLASRDAGRATRAVHDSMPFLQSAESVTVPSVNPDTGSGGHGAVPGAGIALCLARHGVQVEVATIEESGSGVADTILSRAVEPGSDLIVTGAYGHSRTREWVFGGVTQSLRKHSAIPSPMSHRPAGP